MTAYGAVISLRNTIHYIYNSCHFSLVEPSRTIIQLAYDELQPLQEILERLDKTSTSRSRKKVNAVDGRIKDLIWEAEEKLESLVTDQILSQFAADQVDEEMKESVWEFLQSHAPNQLERTTRRRRLVHKHKGGHSKSTTKAHTSQSRSTRIGGKRDAFLFSIDLRRLQDDVDSFIHALKDLEEEYIDEVDNMAEDEEAASTTIGFDGTNSKMIGLSDQFQKLKEDLMVGGRHVRTLVGMAGVGKTTLAKKVYQDPQILSYFECRAWITVGRKPRPLQVPRGIVAQLCGTTLTEGDEDEDEEIMDYLNRRLRGKTCLVVLDDVWETQVLENMMCLLPYYDDRCTFMIAILVTARDRSVAAYKNLAITTRNFTVMRFLNEEESKNLLCEKVFGEEICPPHLDKAATKIAKNCEGLPLMIVTVADIISKSDQNRDLDYWEDVAEQRNSVFTDAYKQISEVLFPSFDYLPQYLKMPFLFMGVFHREYDTPPSKIINMFSAEGWFLHTNTKKSFDESVWECLDKLCGDKHLVLFNTTTMYEHAKDFDYGKYKTCRLHSSWRHVCRGEARKNKFYQVLNKLDDGLEEGVKGRRCLCLENNLLFGFKDIRDSVRLNCSSSARSLLFLGPYHQYPTPIDVGFRLLRELDALQLRFYTFPIEILALVHLKYLALTCNGEIPPTISKLFNLQVLIIHPHINIRCRKAPSYVPIQIWDMQELKHIEILGKSLVAPSHVASLEKLLTLVGVNASFGTILELSRRIPNIRKLVVHIELTPYDDHNDLLSCFGSISELESLETLKCSIINPVAKSGYVFPATPGSLKLPRGLKKLHLSGMGFPWEYMDVIGSLPHLEVLKLRSYAFRGPTWEAQSGSFSRLKFLLIEDTDLVYLNLSFDAFDKLRYVIMKHCYKLEGFYWLYFIRREIELVDCNPKALTCAEQLHMKPFSKLDVTASLSFHEKPMTINLKRSYWNDGHTVEDDGEDLVDYSIRMRMTMKELERKTVKERKLIIMNSGP